MSSDLKTLVFGILAIDLLLFISLVGLDLAAIARYLRHRPYKIPRQRIIELLHTDGPFLAEIYKDFSLYDSLHPSGSIGEVIGTMFILLVALILQLLQFRAYAFFSIIGLIWTAHTMMTTYILYRTWRFTRAISNLP